MNGIIVQFKQKTITPMFRHFVNDVLGHLLADQFRQQLLRSIAFQEKKNIIVPYVFIVIFQQVLQKTEGLLLHPTAFLAKIAIHLLCSLILVKKVSTTAHKANSVPKSFPEKSGAQNGICSKIIDMNLNFNGQILTYWKQCHSTFMAKRQLARRLLYLRHSNFRQPNRKETKNMTPNTVFLSNLKPTEAVKHVTAAEIQRKWNLIDQEMASCGAAGTIVQAVPGPRVTRFELDISKADAKMLCKQLEKSADADSLLARWLSEKRLSLEIPNDTRQDVSAYELFNSDEWQNTQMALPIMLGMGDNYASVMIDLATAPHLLIGGCTGTGKSVCMQMALASLMQKYSPDDLKLLIFDMKAVEFTWMRNSPNLMRPVITDIEQALDELEALKNEMDQRFQLLEKAKVRDIAEYNAKGNGVMPCLIVILDEFADFMCSENHLAFKALVNRLVSCGRAVGIHIILSTQRPDSRVLPCEILINFPTRIVFKCAELSSSKLLLGESGAEKLLGQGDMLLKTPAGLVRLQGGYLPYEELAIFANSLKSDISETTESESVCGTMKNTDDACLQNSMEILQKVVRIIIEERETTTSYLQRCLSVGYNEACKLIETMEKCGIISSLPDSGSRSILVDDVEEAIKRLSKKESQPSHYDSIGRLTHDFPAI